MTDMDAIQFTHAANEKNIKYDEKLLLLGSKGNDFNPFITNKVFMILYGKMKRI